MTQSQMWADAHPSGWRGVHPEGIPLDPEIFGIEGHPEGETGGEVRIISGATILNLMH